MITNDYKLLNVFFFGITQNTRTHHTNYEDIKIINQISSREPQVSSNRPPT